MSPEQIDADSSEQERRRIRNRLAQRKYRSNLKQRIQDLEKLAARDEDSGQDHKRPPVKHVAVTGSPNTELSHLDLPASKTNAPKPFNRQAQDTEMQSIALSNSWAPSRTCTNSAMTDSLPDLTKTVFPGEDLYAGTFWFEEPGIPASGSHHNVDNSRRPSLRKETNPMVGLEPTLQCPTASIDMKDSERPLADVLRHAQALGFENFDSVIMQYYTENFSGGSAMHSVQKMSRRRQLPGLLQGLWASSSQWSLREANGYKEEIMKSSENILMDEVDHLLREICDEHGKDSRVTWSAPPSGQALIDFADNSSITDVELSDKLPNLWALANAFAADRPIPDQQYRYEILLKVILMVGKIRFGSK